MSAASKACQQREQEAEAGGHVLLERTIVLVFMSRYRGGTGGQLLPERTIALVFIIHFICFVQYASQRTWNE
jgi:hypothetical protein